MENNEVKITEARYNQLLESQRRERVMMEILMKIALKNADNGSRTDPEIVAEMAQIMLESKWFVPFRILKSKSQLNGYDAAHNLVIIDAEMEVDFSIKRNI